MQISPWQELLQVMLIDRCSMKESILQLIAENTAYRSLLSELLIGQSMAKPPVSRHRHSTTYRTVMRQTPAWQTLV